MKFKLCFQTCLTISSYYCDYRKIRNFREQEIQELGLFPVQFSLDFFLPFSKIPATELMFKEASV